MIAATATAASSSSSHGTNLLVPRFVAWTVASLPLTVWVRDSLVDVCRVQGTSMEPVLRDGDILLVRKCDPGALVEGLVDLAASLRSRIVSGVDNNNNNHNDDSARQFRSSSIERARLLRHEQSLGVGMHAPVARLYDSPPLALPGHVAIYQDPTSYPIQLNVKRVIGVGGQCVRPRTSFSDTKYHHHHHPRRGNHPRVPRSSAAMVVVPPYALYVEGA